MIFTAKGQIPGPISQTLSTDAFLHRCLEHRADAGFGYALCEHIPNGRWASTVRPE